MAKPKTNKKSKVKNLDNTSKIVQIKKQVSILGVGEVGIKALYKLSELNFTSYNTFKVETRDEFIEFNDDYEIHKLDIKKSKMIVILGDYTDTLTNLKIINIIKECKTTTNLITMVSSIEFEGLYEDKIDSIVYFNKDSIERFSKFDMGECLGIITACGLAPTLSPGLLKINLNDLITVLSSEKKYYFGYAKGKNTEIHNVVKKVIESTTIKNTNPKNMLITFWSNNSLSLIDVYDNLKLIQERYKDTVIIAGYTTDIENNKDFEINIIVA